MKGEAMPSSSTRASLPVLALLAVSSVACGAQPPDPAIGRAIAADEAEDEAPGGSFSCDFGLSSGLPVFQAPAVIDRDRMLMAGQPGMITKQLPISFDQQGNVFSGGRYLFDTFEHAQSYANFVEHGYVLDGVQFLARPYFLSPDCHAWRVAGASSSVPIDAQVVMRTERFHIPAGTPWGQVQRVFPAAQAEAQSRGLAAVWLVANQDEGLAQLVYFGVRVGQPDPNVPDFASLGALAGSPSVGDAVAPSGWTRIFDRSQWVFTVWFPFVAGDQGPASLWLNSPPFPAPFCGDGVCEPSRGETGASCPADCAPACGDAVCEPGETQDTCPSDCQL
jgi:hypothetical protein